jgi:membrane protein YqaA with SNARE-associated domain
LGAILGAVVGYVLGVILKRRIPGVPSHPSPAGRCCDSFASMAGSGVPSRRDDGGGGHMEWIARYWVRIVIAVALAVLALMFFQAYVVAAPI